MYTPCECLLRFSCCAVVDHLIMAWASTSPTAAQLPRHILSVHDTIVIVITGSHSVLLVWRLPLRPGPASLFSYHTVFKLRFACTASTAQPPKNATLQCSSSRADSSCYQPSRSSYLLEVWPCLSLALHLPQALGHKPWLVLSCAARGNTERYVAIYTPACATPTPYWASQTSYHSEQNRHLCAVSERRVVGAKYIVGRMAPLMAQMQAAPAQGSSGDGCVLVQSATAGDSHSAKMAASGASISSPTLQS